MEKGNFSLSMFCIRFTLRGNRCISLCTYRFDTSSWLDDVNIYKYNFGSAQNRKETDMRDKFIKIRIRYSGKELAIIDFINTIYQVSYA